MQQKMKERMEMNKKELRNMKLLEATDELIKLAKEDVPVFFMRPFAIRLKFL